MQILDKLLSFSERKKVKIYFSKVLKYTSMPGSHSKLSKSNGESHNGHGRQVVRQILPTLQHEEMENRLRLEHAMQYDASRYYVS